MIVTIGFNKIKSVFDANPKFDFSTLSSNDTIFVLAEGSEREKWERNSYFSPTFEFKGILPTNYQKEQIYHYLKDGGTVITSLVDPEKIISTTICKEEITRQSLNDLNIVTDESIIDIEYSPYNWLIHDLKDLPKLASSFPNRCYEQGDAMIEAKPESISFQIGNQGVIIFTTLLNNATSFTCLKNFQILVDKFKRESKEYVASR
ncbi:hypothetical protein CWR48_19545 [Oceanobacillus arenosus]|uniref:Uncharacterized protein n=1 Tax=Oceanobacillus arenosus TaxID=1229153 RepID=A0A3D8PGM1_9BACI|nr:hypothetical protein [Oceanobacillus arenosus]RDW15223.1 hypothetical protein CWR48_19545 [Oceanobacillus arenosus]